MGLRPRGALLPQRERRDARADALLGHSRERTSPQRVVTRAGIQVVVTGRVERERRIGVGFRLALRLARVTKASLRRS
jgi:hypothetical protein